MAADGAVDFGESRPLDRTWNLRLQWLAQAYEEKSRLRVLDRAFQRNLACMATGDAQAFNTAAGYARNQLARIEALERPWLQLDSSTGTEDIHELYRTMWGDMSDPDYRARAEEVGRRIRSGDF